MEQLHPNQEQLNRIETLNNLLHQLNQIQLPNSKQIFIPSELYTNIIEPIEQESQLIHDQLILTEQLNRTYLAYNAYQLMIDNIKLAENATNEAENAFLNSTTTIDGQQITWQNRLQLIINKRDSITNRLNNQSIIYNSHNETLNLIDKQLETTDNDLSTLNQIALNNLKLTKNIVNKGKYLLGNHSIFLLDI